MLAKSIAFLLTLSVATANIGWVRSSTQVSLERLPKFHKLTTAPRIHGSKVLRSKTYPNGIRTCFRGGTSGADNVAYTPFQKIIRGLLSTIKFITTICLPPFVAAVRSIITFYRSLPKDILIAQIGLVYCFCGGSYPLLFAAIQAARVTGLQDMLSALSDLADEATIAVEATKKEIQYEATSFQDAVSKTTLVVMKAVDPAKINTACASLYTSWLGISIVLEKEFAKTINYAITLGNYISPIIDILLAPPVYLAVRDEYHQWVPVGLGWISKIIAMRVAWRLQRVLTACTSSVIGGLMFSRALMRVITRKGPQRKGVEKGTDLLLLDEALGYIAATAGIYVQLGDGTFDPRVKFPLSVLTLPFDVAENWIQWKITEKKNN
mmetsp:Transcript_12468/g.18299  ORF Transcript_12468/g.18299 Transcript_12468/m.18299 type:complete len:380 (+) Transcript_12468:24-1163(+)